MDDSSIQQLDAALSSAYRYRQPVESELEFFRQNRHVGAYAAEDKSVALNPFSPLSLDKQLIVGTNERVRLWLRDHAMQSSFQISPAQSQWFEQTPYRQDQQAQLETILARILTGDPSLAPYSDEQIASAEQLRLAIMGKP